MADLDFEMPVTSVIHTLNALDPFGNRTGTTTGTSATIGTGAEAASRVVMKGSALLTTLGFDRVDESDAIHTLLIHICVYSSLALIFAYIFHIDTSHTHMGKHWKYVW